VWMDGGWGHAVGERRPLLAVACVAPFPTSSSLTGGPLGRCGLQSGAEGVSGRVW
jgi:hypothetical protein